MIFLELAYERCVEICSSKSTMAFGRLDESNPVHDGVEAHVELY